MKSALVVSVAVVILVGCAITPEQASKMSNYDLCRALLIQGGADRKASAERYLRERKEDCKGYYPMLQAERASNDAMLNTGAAMMINSQPQRQAPTNCTYRAIGNTVQQTCF